MQKRSIALITCGAAIALMVASTPAALRTSAQVSPAATVGVTTLAAPATAISTSSATLSATAKATTAATVTATPFSDPKFSDLLTGAQYFAADAPVYVSIRTDAAFLKSADAVIGRIEKALPASILPASARTSLTQTLDVFTQFAFQQNLPDAQKWLGPSVAFGVNDVRTLYPDSSLGINLNETSTSSFALVAPITDQVAADTAIGNLITQFPDGAWIRKVAVNGDISYDDSGATSYSNQQIAILIRHNVLVIGTVAGVAEVSTHALQAGSLADQSLFKETVALLPAPSYNALAYLDAPAIFARSAGVLLNSYNRYSSDSYSSGSSFANNAQALNLISSLLSSHLTGPQAWGATLLNDNTLTIDIAQHVGNRAMLAAAGLTQASTTPVDPKFLALLPSNTVFALQIANVPASYDTALANVGAIWDLLPVSILSPINDNLYALIDAQPPTSPDSGKASIQRLLRSVDVFLTGTTGLTGPDVRALFGGNLLIGLTTNPTYSAASNGGTGLTPFGFVGISEIAGTVNGTTLVNTMARQLQLTFDTIAPTDNTHVETIAGTPTLVITAPSDSYRKVPVEFLLAVGNKTVVFGARDQVTGALTRMNSTTSLSEAPAFAPLFLNNSSVVGYWNPAATSALVKTIAGPNTSPELQNVQAILNLFSTATLSGTTDATGNVTQRLTLSLK